MKVCGIRCSNSDFAFAILDGDKHHPAVIHSCRLAFPANFKEGEKVHWFYHELNSLIQQHSPDSVVIKGPEPLVKRSNSIDSRLHNEGIVFLAAAANGIIDTCKKTNATIAKDLGVKGRTKYLKTKLDTSAIADFESYGDKLQEAILAAWSLMG